MIVWMVGKGGAGAELYGTPPHFVAETNKSPRKSRIIPNLSLLD